MNGLAIHDALAAPGGTDRSEPPWRREARVAALDWLGAHPMPTRRDEPWHYTPVDKVLAALEAAARPDPSVRLDPNRLDALVGDHGGSRVVFVNGAFDEAASRVTASDAESIGAFSHVDGARASASWLDVDRLDGFVALNHLVADDGASIVIGPGPERAEPVHIVHVVAPGPDGSVAAHPQTVVRLAEGARANVIESFVGLGGASFTNAATSIEVGDGASCTYHRIQSEAAETVHIGHVRALVGRDAQIRAASISLGASISRVAFDITLEGDGSSVDIDGLYVPSGAQHHDNVITVEHAGSHTRSTQRFKGVINDRAHGAFTGHIVVRPGTVDTTSHQTNHSILLTPTAQSDSRPWLEILADDVRCTHGATVGRLDEAALFYLRSRGIPEGRAREILIDAFASEITDAVEPQSLRDHLAARIAVTRAHPVDVR